MLRNRTRGVAARAVFCRWPLRRRLDDVTADTAERAADRVEYLEEAGKVGTRCILGAMRGLE